MKPRHDTVYLYDFLHARGGAERVLQRLYQHLPGDVCVGFVSQDSFGDAFAPEDLIDLELFHHIAPVKMARVVHGFNTRAAAVVRNYRYRVYSGAYAVLACRDTPFGRDVYYCHTPPRFLYDLREHYQREFPLWQRPLLAALRWWLQPRYEQAVRRMDVVLANSENVRRRLQRYVGVEAEVVYPPVDTDMFSWQADNGYFLSTARLEPLKRVDRLVRAFRRMPDQQLVIASGGSEYERLRAEAADAPNIHFTGWLDDGHLERLINEARATLYVPVDEDFGMSPVESMAAGKPVIGVAEGGLLETVVDGETGFLLPPDFDEDAVCEAVQRMDSNRAQAMRSACEARAQLFSREIFLQRMASIIRA